MTKTIIICLGIILFCMTSVNAEGILGFVGLKVDAESQYSMWFTSDDDDNEENTGHAIDYDSEGAATWSIAGALRYKDGTWIGGRIQRPFGNAVHQDEILEKTTTATTSLEDYMFYLEFFPLRKISSNPFVVFLSKLRLDYRRNYYFGKGTAVETSIFANRAGEKILLNVGESFQFRADFQDWYLYIMRKRMANGGQFHFGFYRSVLKKPHESIINTSGPAPDYTNGDLVVETKITGYGLAFRLERASFYSLFRVGIVEFEPQADIKEFQLYQSKGSFAFLMDLRWTPRFNLSGTSKRHTIYLSPTMGFLFRFDLLNSNTEGLSVIDTELSMDILIDAGLRFQWMF
jgi:hypothetical protein